MGGEFERWKKLEVRKDEFWLGVLIWTRCILFINCYAKHNEIGPDMDRDLDGRLHCRLHNEFEKSCLYLYVPLSHSSLCLRFLTKCVPNVQVTPPLYLYPESCWKMPQVRSIPLYSWLWSQNVNLPGPILLWMVLRAAVIAQGRSVEIHDPGANLTISGLQSSELRSTFNVQPSMHHQPNTPPFYLCTSG